jgi:hypothetical protein
MTWKLPLASAQAANRFLLDQMRGSRKFSLVVSGKADQRKTNVTIVANLSRVFSYSVR